MEVLAYPPHQFYIFIIGIESYNVQIKKYTICRVCSVHGGDEN
jgi:hypothetical protein